MSPNFVDRTGEVYNDLKIVEELGENKVIAVCLKCGHRDEYNKGNLVKKYTRCKKCYKHIQNIVGNTYNNLKVIQDIDDCRVKAVCLECGHINVYDKRSIACNRIHCKNCWVNVRCIDRKGEVYNNLQIIEELGDGKVKAICLKCNYVDVYDKHKLLANTRSCKNCYLGVKDRVGETYNELKIIEELGGNKVKALCIRCGHIDVYAKNNVVRYHSICKNCGIHTHNVHTFENSIHGNINIIEYLYKGRDNKFYYRCKCLKCGEELILNYDEIFTYKCTKEQQ